MLRGLNLLRGRAVAMGGNSGVFGGVGTVYSRCAGGSVNCGLSIRTCLAGVLISLDHGSAGSTPSHRRRLVRGVYRGLSGRFCLGCSGDRCTTRYDLSASRFGTLFGGCAKASPLGCGVGVQL